MKGNFGAAFAQLFGMVANGISGSLWNRAGDQERNPYLRILVTILALSGIICLAIFI